jgi:hypothetical protein
MKINIKISDYICQGKKRYLCEIRQTGCLTTFNEPTFRKLIRRIQREL